MHDYEQGIDITDRVNKLENGLLRESYNPDGHKESHFTLLLGQVEGVDFNLTDPDGPLGDRVIMSGFYRALEYLIARYYPQTVDEEMGSRNHILMLPQVMPLFSRSGREVSPRIQADTTFPRSSERLAVNATIAMVINAKMRVLLEGDPTKFLLYQQFGEKKKSVEVDYAGALYTVTYDKYQERRYIIAAALALGIPESQWDDLPTIIPEVLPPSAEELTAAQQKFEIEPGALHLGVVINTSLEEKFVPLAQWKKMLVRIEQDLQQQGYDFESRPVHVHVFYNPRSPGALDFPLDQVQSTFGDKLGQLHIHYLGAELSELPAALQLQTVLLSVDTALAHIAAALPEGPEMTMIFEDYHWPANVWQSNHKQHPIFKGDTLEDQFHQTSMSLIHQQMKTGK